MIPALVQNYIHANIPGRQSAVPPVHLLMIMLIHLKSGLMDSLDDDVSL